MNSFDPSDILGGGTLPVGRHQPPSLWSSMPDFAKTSLYTVCCLVSVLFFRDFYYRLLRWRERSYRKTTRRRHGIPDSDQRPFNVAYAAAVNARQERETQSQDKSGIRPVGMQQLLTAQVESQTDRNDNLPGGLYPIRGPSANPSSVANGYNSYDIPPIVISSLSPSVRGNSDTGYTGGPVAVDAAVSHTNIRSPRKSNKIYAPTTRPSKRAFHGDDETEFERYTNKKSRVQDEEELVDHIMEDIEEIPRPKRGSKRMASPDDVIAAEIRSNRGDKRARKISRDPLPQELLDDPMEDTDVLSDTVQSPRGKKRDRVEEDSMFGGDDDDAIVDDPEDKHHRRRKRRTISHKKNPRGQKRNREVEAVESESEPDLDQSTMRRSRKKRGKQMAGSDDNDVSMDIAPVSVNPSFKGRAIGEEWEFGSTRYKVGPNGERLRQTLVKQRRPKYTMPADSEHPDKDVMIEVIVETWLTEEQYQAAKEHFELAWQDSPQVKTESQVTPGDIHSPVKGGKNLLWSSTASHPESPIADRRPFRQSIATNVGLQLIPFHQSQHTGKRRITGVVPSPIAGSPDKPNLKHAKSYSKWEKQDLEAETMSKIKQRLQEQKKTAENQNKAAVPQTSIAPQTTPASNMASTNLFPSSNEKPAVCKDGTATALAPGAPTMKQPEKSFSFAPPPAKTDPGMAPPITSSKGPSTPSGLLGTAAPSIPNFFSTRAANDPSASKPSTTSQPTFNFSSATNTPAAAQPSFNFSTTPTHSQITATVQEPKKVEQPSLASTTASSSTPLFSFAAPKNTPVPETKQPLFSFGVTNKLNTTSPFVSSEPAASPFGNTWQPQQSMSSAQSSPFSFPSQPPPLNNPKVSFGTTSLAKAGGDTGNAVESSVGKPFGGTSPAFLSPSTPSNQTGSSGTEAKLSEVLKPPAFSFGITPSAPSNPSSKPLDATGFSTTSASSPAQSSAFNSAPQSTNKQPFFFGPGTGNTSETASKPKRLFGLAAYPISAYKSSDTSKNTVGFGASTTTATSADESQQSNLSAAAKPAVPSFSFAPASTGAASTPTSFGFGNSGTTTFPFGKPEEK